MTHVWLWWAERHPNRDYRLLAAGVIRLGGDGSVAFRYDLYRRYLLHHMQ